MIDALLDRRSIRQYKPQPVPFETVQKTLEAAMLAPSAMNKQPWHFLVLDDAKKKEELAGVYSSSDIIRGCGAVVLVCADADSTHYQQDCGAAVQNMMVAARDLGLGTCWIGCAPTPEKMEILVKFFALPDAVKPFALVAMGVPDEEKPRPERYAAAKVHRNSW